jgi:hypothetical protein
MVASHLLPLSLFTCPLKIGILRSTNLLWKNDNVKEEADEKQAR